MTDDVIADLERWIHEGTARTPDEWAEYAFEAAKLKKTRREHLRPFVAMAVRAAIDWHLKEIERLKA